MNKLSNAPLKEAICELRWALSPDEYGQSLIDPDFSMAVGKFQGSIENSFPFHVRKVPNAIPDQLLAYQIIHQFWSDQNVWPVMQIGPGIASLNDTDVNYEWEKTYLPNIKKLMTALECGYGKQLINQISLRYIDVVNVSDYGFTSWEEFIHTNVKFEFSNRFNIEGTLSSFFFDQSFQIDQLGLVNVGISNGKNNVGEDTFIWQTAVSIQRQLSNNEVIHWVERAHNLTSKLFKDICSDVFYSSFK